MKSCQCPNCTASLTFDDNREFGFCQYCGTKIMLDDYRTIHRYVDEARIKEAETERIIRMRELELEEKEYERGRKGRKLAYIIALAFVLFGVLLGAIFPTMGLFGVGIGGWIALFAFMSGDEKKKKVQEARYSRMGMIKLTEKVVDYEKQNYRSIEAAFSALGFINITTVNLHDLKAGIIKKSEAVEEVTIDGEEPNYGDWYSPNARVIITYHGF